MSEQRVVVMGLGNLLWADEGFGVRVAERLYAHYHWPEQVEIVDGGTQGLNLLGYVESASHLLILDAIDYGLAPGTLRTYAGEMVPAYLSAKKMSLHQSSFSEVLALADIRGHMPSRVALVGLQPALLDEYGGSLTEVARAQLPAAEQAALAQLADWGIVPRPSEESRCLNYECLSMENYEGVRIRQYRMTLEGQEEC
ncbi:hydrogenase 1 maturation protease [Edwardsiella piscicida]|uniref:hydrogenase 1 maturation protease n=1 Tax=Edwardsiella piscicida TaxID=1263550 RepID=UPI001CED5CC1|nr:hydrogenase 1 maturation protease [Edwardsiella piscicida]AOP44207.2 hydrogenase 1 maturation protease [Edwardsiella piscicida]UCQ30821.1 hydrogenase 1 maturation protease [Edwardsiella piscicida]UCQ57147.1 hydrogenase 1 maturation protease [Edwardsiella piscicida]